MRQPIDQFAKNLSDEVYQAVRGAAAAGVKQRINALHSDYENPDDLRKLAAKIRQHSLDHLDEYLVQAEQKLQENGVVVHWAESKETANQTVLEILKANQVRSVIKTKSMVTEETELVPFLIKEGIDCLESDLGEFIVQIEEDHPSHIVKPILHMNRRQVARAFERCGLGPYDDDPEHITRAARKYFRRKYVEADAAITGANFLVAETGRLVLVTNEGNARFCLAPADTHIAVVGIEKILPRERDLAVVLNLLARSATGQHLTVYTEFLSGPRYADQTDGPSKMHVVFLDNQRSHILADRCREILRCIRCGACMNVCPVYRQASGHAYRGVYPGPLGAVLEPLMMGEEFGLKADLPKASSLCGACQEVCPVDIPIPDLLLRLRDRGYREKQPSAVKGSPPWKAWAGLGTSPVLWRNLLSMGKLLNVIPHQALPVPAMRDWTRSRELPRWKGGEFRRWWKQRHSKQCGHGCNHDHHSSDDKEGESHDE